jgi:hypothetical protein
MTLCVKLFFIKKKKEKGKVFLLKKRSKKRGGKVFLLKKG